MPFNLKLIYSLIMAWKLLWFSLLNADLKICILLNDKTVQEEIDWSQYMKDALNVMPPAYFYGYWQINTTGKRARSQLQITPPPPSQSHHHCLYIYRWWTRCHMHKSLHQQRWPTFTHIAEMHYPLSDCTHIYGLVSVNIWQVLIKVNGYCFFCIEEFIAHLFNFMSDTILPDCC